MNLRLKWPAVAVIFSCMISPAGGARSDTAVFRVEKTDGDVRYREPWSAVTQTIDARSNLPLGTILFLGTGATMTVRIQDANTIGETRQSHNISLSGPGVYRIEEQFIRRTRLTNAIFQSDTNIMAVNSGRAADQDGDTASLEFSDAWTRVKAVLTKNGSLQAYYNWIRERVLRNEKVMVSTTTENISLFTTTGNIVIKSSSAPANVDLSWKPKIKSPDVKLYAVYMWKKGESPDKPYVVTKGVNYAVRIQVPGEYLVQIKTIDGEWSSNIREVHVEQRSGKPATTARDSARPELSPVLYLPPDRLNILTRDEVTRISFSWGMNPRTASIPGSAPDGWTLWLTPVSGEPALSFATNLTSVTVALKPGSYRWYVVPHHKDGANIATNRMSAIREIGVQSAATAEMISSLELISRALSGDQNQTILLEEGL